MEKAEYEIVDGKLLNYNDLTNNEKLKIYPDDTEDEVYKGNQYIFFEIFEKDYKFYTLRHWAPNLEESCAII